MNPGLTSVLVALCFLAAVVLGIGVRRCLPDHHLNADTKDTVKLAMGLVATMAALLLGLLISSAKSTYDSTRSQVIQMAGKVAFADRVLSLYGPAAAPARELFQGVVKDGVARIWPGEGDGGAGLAPNVQAGNAAYFAILNLAPQTDAERSLKAVASGLTVDLAQLRMQLQTAAIPSVSKPFLLVVVAWLSMIFLSFSVFAPQNGTANAALMVSVLAVAGAVFLILELDRPFDGIIRIPSAPMRTAMGQFGS